MYEAYDFGDLAHYDANSLSGYLYEITSNDTYKTNAQLSLNFMNWPGYAFNGEDFAHCDLGS